MNKKWMPKVAGILLIISGLPQILIGIFFILALFLGSYDSDASGYVIEFCMIFGPLAISGALILTGGIYALKRKKWPLALACSIFTLTPFAIWVRVVCLPYYTIRDFLPFGVSSTIALAIGIVAIILTVLSRKQFNGKQAAG